MHINWWTGNISSFHLLLAYTGGTPITSKYMHIMNTSVKADIMQDTP